MAKRKVEKVLTFQERVALLAGKYSETIFQQMNEPTKWPLQVISTGCLAFDVITDAGGYPERRFVELWGPPETGKTTVATGAIVEQSLKGQQSVLIDVEHKLVEDYFRECIERAGGDNNYVLYIAPESGGMAVELIEDLIGHCKLIVVDSICSLTAKIAMEVDGVEDQTPASTARLVTSWVQRAKFPLGISGTCKRLPVATVVLGINQVRAQWGASWGDGLKSAGGGWAWDHFCSMRIKLGGSTKVNNEADPEWTEVTAWVIKNSVGRPKMRSEKQLVFFGMGIDRARDLLGVGPDYGTIIKKGNWYYTLEGDQEVRIEEQPGIERARLALWAAPELLNRLRDKTHACIVAGKRREQECLKS